MSNMRKVKLQIIWMREWEECAEDVVVRLSDDMIQYICKQKKSSLKDLVYGNSTCLKLYDELSKMFNDTHGEEDEEYQEYLYGRDNPDYIMSYSEWLEGEDIFEIDLSEITGKYSEQMIIFAVDCYSGTDFLKTIYLYEEPKTQDILRLIDCCLEGKAIEENEGLSAFRHLVEEDAATFLNDPVPYSSLVKKNYKIRIPGSIYDLASESGTPVSEKPEPLDYDHIVIHMPRYENPDLVKDEQPEDEPEEKPEEKTTVQPVEQTETIPVVQPEIKPQQKEEEKKKHSPAKLIALVLLLIIAALGIFVYRECFVPRSAVLLDKDQVAYVEVDGYYDEFDYRLDNKDDWLMISQHLDYFDYVRVLNPFEKVEDSGQRVGVTFYDKEGNPLEEVICYNDERIRINGVLCKPVNMSGGIFSFPSSLTHVGRIRIQEVLQVEVDRLIRDVRVEEDGCVAIDIIDIPFPDGTYSKVWVDRTQPDSDKTKKIVYLDISKQDYEHLPGYLMTIPLMCDSEGEKYTGVWLNIDACGLTFTFDLSEIIPDQLRAE